MEMTRDNAHDPIDVNARCYERVIGRTCIGLIIVNGAPSREDSRLKEDSARLVVDVQDV
jgi:hypothetical protein